MTIQPVAFPFDHTPPVFESYQGPADSDAVYVSRGADTNLSLLRDGAVLDFGPSLFASMNPASVAGQTPTPLPLQDVRR